MSVSIQCMQVKFGKHSLAGERVCRDGHSGNPVPALTAAGILLSMLGYSVRHRRLAGCKQTLGETA